MEEEHRRWYGPIQSPQYGGLHRIVSPLPHKQAEEFA
jgi:hypothetical protein